MSLDLWKYKSGSDVYSFGLCILFAGTLEMMSLYDIRKFVEMTDVKKYLNKKFKNNIILFIRLIKLKYFY